MTPPDADELTSLLEPDLHPVEAARRLLTIQFKLIRRNVPGTLRSTSTKPLHDLRVAMRRFRTVIRLFRRQLAGTSASEISGELQQITRTLGPARDLDVWIEYLENLLSGARSDPPPGSRY